MPSQAMEPPSLPLPPPPSPPPPPPAPLHSTQLFQILLLFQGLSDSSPEGPDLPASAAPPSLTTQEPGAVPQPPLLFLPHIPSL